MFVLAGSRLGAATLSDARITEFLTSNTDGIADSDGDRSDWIEIWNASGVGGDLGGWHLTDDPANLTKWTFPAAGLESGAYLLVFASGKDRTDPASELHCNFKLGSTAGNYLALVKPDGLTIASEFASYPEQLSDIAYGSGFEAAAPVTLVETADAAKWLVPSGPFPGWTETGFDDSAWTAGTTGIGFDGIGGSYIPYLGPGYEALRTAMFGLNATAYIRVPFEVSSPAGITDLVLGMRWEDGFVAYLNGSEIARERAPATPAWNSTSDPATNRPSETDAVTFFEYPLTVGSLVAGTNVLAIQGLNSTAGSSDFLISPRLTALRQNTVDLIAGFFPEPTPGAQNTSRFDGITADTKFSVDRGLKSAPFDLIIITATADATIRYTTDGTPPSETSGTIYTGPIPIGATTVVRAMAYKSGFRPTNIDTHTYIFPADVATQPTMRSVIGGIDYGPQIVDALNSIPTIALNFAGNDIDYTELPVSVELLNFEGGPKQVNAGVARFGSYVTNFAKHSVRLQFRSAYGPSRLRYPLFDGHDYSTPPVENFDALDLRAGNHDMVARGAYLSNRFTDDSMLEMGHLAPHGRFVHLYFNGQYRGQYHLRERWDAAMLASYFPGPEAEYDTLNANNTGSEFLTGDLQDGTLVEWNQIQSLLAGPTPFNSVRDKLDVPDLIDFMLLWTAGNSESEFRSGGSPRNGVGFKFLMKDADGYLRPPDGSHPVTHNGPLSAMTRFRNEGNPDFKILLADRIHKHFFNDGALTPARNIARLQRRVDESRLSFIAESARWATHANTANHTPVQWLAYQNNLINNQLPARTAEQMAKFRAAGMYPATIAPVLSPSGGSVPSGAGVTMSTNGTAIYYTLDGSDPRASGGAVSATAIQAPFQGDPPEPQDFIVTGTVWRYLDDGSNQGTGWRGATFDDSAWAAGPSELGYGDGDEMTSVGFIDADPGTGVIRNATTYFRHQVTIDSPSGFSYFLLKMKYDDGAAIFINGNEVVRTANLPAGAAFDTYATSTTPNENTYFEFTIPASAFVDGVNTLAVEIHNQSGGSSDISFDLRLRGELDLSNGDKVTQPVILGAPAPLNARAFNSSTGEWSALTSAFFSIDSTPATAANLAISEIHYHPAEPTTPGEIAISTDRDDYEFIELLNVGTQPIDLTGVYFSAGINYAFPNHALLEPGARTVIVRHIAAFTERYGGAVPVAGEYSGRLSNDGEEVTLSLVGVGVLRDFTYNDQFPWPTLPDGAGYSLVLRAPSSHPDYAVAENWAAHAVIGGAPGAADSIQAGGYATWKAENGITDDADDRDADGLVAIVEYALGTSPARPSPEALPTPGITTVGEDRFLTISFGRNAAATDIIFQLQSSTNLADWQNETPIEVAANTFRTGTPLIPGMKFYLRLAISQ